MCYALLLPVVLSMNSSTPIRAFIQGPRSSPQQQLNLSPFLERQRSPARLPPAQRGQRGRAGAGFCPGCLVKGAWQSFESLEENGRDPVRKHLLVAGNSPALLLARGREQRGRTCKARAGGTWGGTWDFPGSAGLLCASLVLQFAGGGLCLASGWQQPCLLPPLRSAAGRGLCPPLPERCSHPASGLLRPPPPREVSQPQPGTLGAERVLERSQRSTGGFLHSLDIPSPKGTSWGGAAAYVLLESHQPGTGPGAGSESSGVTRGSGACPECPARGTLRCLPAS